MSKRGFTLLEVMVALSILALALTSIAGINANSFESSNYARGLTVATLLARAKMLDIELELQKDGFGEGPATSMATSRMKATPN
ncbi:MAG: prepilin-type N-terminal cleavage/methylation domain-containing protein [Myxococcales bacterium]|nr:prepilin-type N-terminal cleavage/methylation domain-containing protein [Myxococcales bacterium]